MITPAEVLWAALVQLDQHFLPQTLEGWFNLIGRIAVSAAFAWGLVVATVKRMVDAEANERKKAVEGVAKAVLAEEEDRKLADSRIEERNFDLATKLQTLMGKFEIMREDIHTAEKERIREMETLKREMSSGFSKIEGILLRGSYSHGRREDK
jgi:hypothetical protein